MYGCISRGKSGVNTFGDKLKALRTKTGKSQATVAKELGISQTYVAALELRDTPPKTKIVRLLVDYFKVNPSYFQNNPHAPTDEDMERRLGIAEMWIEDIRQGRKTDYSEQGEAIRQVLSEMRRTIDDDF